MSEQEKTLATYKEYLLECANHDSLDFTAINEKYEYKVINDARWHVQHEATIICLVCSDSFRRKKRTVVVNGKTVPAPMDREPKHGEEYCCLNNETWSLVSTYRHDGPSSEIDRKLTRAGWFDNEQDASGYFKALLGVE